MEYKINYTKYIFVIVVLAITTNMVIAQISLPVKPVKFYEKDFNINPNNSFNFSNQSKKSLKKFNKHKVNDNIYGIGMNSNINAMNLEWDCSSTECNATIRIKASGVKGFKFDFKNFYFPQNSYMFIYSVNSTQYYGAYSNLNNRENQIFSTSIISGSDIIIEINSNKENKDSINFLIYRIGMVYRNNIHVGEALDCHNNVNCNPWRTSMCNQIRSVVKYTFWREFFGDTVLSSCSGALLDSYTFQNNEKSFIPYILTARHCFGKAIDLATVTIYFNFQSPVCNETGNEFNDRLTLTGIETIIDEILAASLCEDIGIIKPIDKIPLQYNVFYTGWKRFQSFDNLPNDVGTVIHHPMGDIKKLTEGEIQKHNYGFPTPWKERPCFEFYNNNGILESGSSGSPLFIEDRYVIGTFFGDSGDPPGCGNVPESIFSNIGHDDVWSDVKEILSPDFPFTSSEGSDPIGYCLQNVDLFGFFYPASDWQAQNEITIQAEKKIVLAANEQPTFITSSPHQIEGQINFSEYIFRSGENIVFKPGFSIENGNNMLAIIDPNPCNPFTGCGFNYQLMTTFDDENIYDSIHNYNAEKDLEKSLNIYSEKNYDFKINVYPNPSKGIMNVSAENTNIDFVKIYDLKGSLIKSYKINPGINYTSLDISVLSSGNYILRVFVDKKTYIDKKIQIIN